MNPVLPITFWRKSAIAAAFGLASITDGRAILFSQPDLAADYAINESPLAADQSGTTASSSFLAGAFGSNGQNGVYVFSLPALGSNSAIASASLQFTYLGSGTNDTSNARVDLWGIGFQSSTTPIVKYLEADTDADPVSVKLQDNLLTPGTQRGEIVTSASGNSALTLYLQNFYSGNPAYTGGSYVFLRLNPDANVTTTGTSQGYLVEVAENDSPDPVLTINAIPEPSSLLLFAASSVIAVVYAHGRRIR